MLGYHVSRRLFAVLAALSIGVVACDSADHEVGSPTYEFGESGIVTIHNPTDQYMAHGGCNPNYYLERLPGRWVPDPLIRLACAFWTDENGRHELQYRYTLIPPGGSLDIGFPTDWVASLPAIIRVLIRISKGCTLPAIESDPIVCEGVDVIKTDPIVVFEPGTSEVYGRR
jgi:hypothetical protein